MTEIASRVNWIIAQRQYLDYYEDTPWAKWLVEVLPETFVPRSGIFVPFSDYHRDFWEWTWSIEPGEPTEAFLPVWPRDAGKSSNAEAAVVYLAGEKKRKYAIYSADSQPRADEHLGNVSALLERPGVQQRYPELCDKALTQWGAAKGWRVGLLRCANGFSAASAGLDKAVRGTRLEDQRPDLLVLDDIDADHDSARAVEKKEKTITSALLPAGDRGTLAVIFAQNLVHDNSVMAHILDGKADFLRDRRVSGPHPAILDMKVEEKIDEQGKRLYHITEGTPTWDGMGLEVCESIINQIGLRAFRAEHQHERGAKAGALWDRDVIESCRRERPAHLVKITVNIDPETSSDPSGSKTGLTVTARAADGHGYLLANHTDHYKGTTLGPGGTTVDGGWGQKVCDLVEEWDADCVVAETNQGGDMVRSIVHLINPNINVQEVRAKHGKFLRAEPIAQLYWRGLIHHVGIYEGLEDQLCEVYDPHHPSITWDDMDSMVYGFRHLLLNQQEILPALDPNKHRVQRPGISTTPLQVI